MPTNLMSACFGVAEKIWPDCYQSPDGAFLALGKRQKLEVSLAKDAVALTGCLLKARTIDNRDVTSPLSD